MALTQFMTNPVVGLSTTCECLLLARTGPPAMSAIRSLMGCRLNRSTQHRR